jgi:DNA (cytosine-5)-methyltransferase 1
MIHLDLFSGIGGFAYAADQVWDDVEHIFCDNDTFCQQVLKKHWPEAKIYDDIRTITEHPKTDLLTGGFPCQPFSQAGKRKGTTDDRYLWPEMLRVIQLTKPTWVIAENVRGLLTLQGGLVFQQVCLDLEASGYEVQPFIIPAVALNAPHRRDRVWFVAHSLGSSGEEEVGKVNAAENGLPQEHRKKRSRSRKPIRATRLGGERATDWLQNGGSIPERDITDPKSIYAQRQHDRQKQVQFRREDWRKNWLEVATELCGVDDGLPSRVDRLKALGNAIVPQVAIEIMKGMA